MSDWFEPMVPDVPSLHPDRRAVLRAVAGGVLASLTALAGCSSPSSTPTPTRTERPSVPYDSLFVRNPAGESFVTTGSSDSERPIREPLSSADEADRVTFTTDVDGVDDVRVFLAETDFETETVLLAEQPIGECQELVVDYVTTSEDSFNVDFCSRLRPADVECSVDERDVVLAAVRFRHAGGVSSYTVGSGGSCERWGRGEDR